MSHDEKIKHYKAAAMLRTASQLAMQYRAADALLTAQCANELLLETLENEIGDDPDKITDELSKEAERLERENGQP